MMKFWGQKEKEASRLRTDKSKMKKREKQEKRF